MTNNKWCFYGLLRPFIPFVNMQVGAADGGLLHADQHVVVADAGRLDVLHPDARRGRDLGMGAEQ